MNASVLNLALRSVVDRNSPIKQTQATASPEGVALALTAFHQPAANTTFLIITSSRRCVPSCR